MIFLGVLRGVRDPHILRTTSVFFLLNEPEAACFLRLKLLTPTRFLHFAEYTLVLREV